MPSDAYMLQLNLPSDDGSDNGLAPTSDGILLIGPLETNSLKFESKCKQFQSRNSIWKCLLETAAILS